MSQEVLYQCNLCNYVIKPREEDPVPSYCPNCAIRNQKGEMLPVSYLTAQEGGFVKEST